jgi:hypothetical protein
MKKCYFDHKTKPSTFVVKNNGEEIFRGNFTEGYKIFQDLPRNTVTEFKAKEATENIKNKE